MDERLCEAAAAKLASVLGTIEHADRIAETADGPVLHVRDILTDAQWRTMYVLLTEAHSLLAGPNDCGCDGPCTEPPIVGQQTLLGTASSEGLAELVFPIGDGPWQRMEARIEAMPTGPDRTQALVDLNAMLIEHRALISDSTTGTAE